MNKSILILFLVCFFSINVFTQTRINGTLLTEKGQPIFGASITINELNSENTLSYDISDNKGSYSILLNKKVEKLELNIRSMGFKNITKIIDNKTQTLNYILEEEITKLKEIVIKSSPITRKGDTINYSVKAFSKLEDRTISDVLKNMPGIEVLDSGKILYQGKPINKYYIEGLDLLEGKYSLANKNLPYKEVSKVQILENHQPIKMLDSLVYSDKAAINIKLKNSYTFTGQAEIGTGFTPLLWDINVTPMLFSKKRQMLSSYQTNNTGNDVASQLKHLTIENLLEQFERNDEKQDWLSIQKLQIPNFTKQRWLDNNIHLITTNYLQQLKKDYELRLNISYLNDYQKQKGFKHTQFFITNDTISLFEKKYNQLQKNTLETNLTLQKNTDKNFLKNSFQFKKFWDNQLGNILLNNNDINQNLKNNYFKLSNNFKVLFPFGKKIATLNSYTGFSKTPESLKVNPGQFKELINKGNNYSEVTQNIELNTFYTNNFLGFTKGWGKFSFSPKVGFQFEKQSLKSDISILENTFKNFENNLDWLRTKFYLVFQTQYKKDKFRMELKTPISLYNFELEDKLLQSNQNINRLTFEPRFILNYDINNLWRINSSVNLNNQFGGINQVYYNFILLNYRNIQRLNVPIPQTYNINYSTFISYKNPIKALFLNLSYSNKISYKNLLYNSQILNNGSINFQAVKQNNERKNHDLSFNANKYFGKIKSNVAFNTYYSIQNYQQILNTKTTDIQSKNWGFNGKIEIDITDWLNTELNSNFQFSKNQIQKQNIKTISQQSHKFNLNIYPNQNQYIGLKTEYVKNNQFSEGSKNIFADLVFRYTLKKKKIDFKFQFNNIFNTQNFRTIDIDNFSYIESNFVIRPRQVLFNIRFSL